MLLGANLSNATFRGANLTNACLNNADFKETDFRDANLTGVIFLTGMDLSKAKLEGVIGYKKP